MTDPLAPAAVRLAKLLPVLASDKDGEVVAAARAIGRTLGAVGADFHDLAASLACPSALQGTLPRTATKYHRLVLRLLSIPATLFPSEHRFLAEMARLAQRGKMPSPKQAAWIEKIARRHQ